MDHGLVRPARPDQRFLLHLVGVAAVWMPTTNPSIRRIRALMRRIHERGHEIGLYPSYGTYQKPELIAQEAERRLRAVMAEENIRQT